MYAALSHVLSPYFNVFSGKLQYNFAVFKIGNVTGKMTILIYRGGMAGQKAKNLI